MKLLGKSLLELKNLVDKKEILTSELWDYFGKRIAKYDKELNSYVTTPDVILSEQSESKDLSADSLPIAIKDNFNTKGIRTTASSYVLKDFVPPYSATVVEKLYKSGFGTLGKTNMDAWAHGSSTETSDFGTTKNPYDHSRVAGGSSGGSAAAVAAYLAPASIGTETAGSIRQPASWCGVVGLKPTYGRVSRYGVIAMGSSWDCPGPITSNVEDAAYLLSLIAGKDPYDATSSNIPVSNYLLSLEKQKKLVVGICNDYFQPYLQFENTDPATSYVDNFLINEIIPKLDYRTEQVHLFSPKYSISTYTILQRAEVSSNLARYDGIRFGANRSYFGKEAKRRIMLGTYTLSQGYYDAYYKTAEKVRMLIRANFEEAFKKVDVIIAPSVPVSALKIGESEKYPFFGEMMDMLNEPAAAAGIPAINIPIGHDRKGLPVGIQIMGKHFDEESILNIAYHLEYYLKKKSAKKEDFERLNVKIEEKYPDL